MPNKNSSSSELVSAFRNVIFHHQTTSTLQEKRERGSRAERNILAISIQTLNIPWHLWGGLKTNVAPKDLSAFTHVWLFPVKVSHLSSQANVRSSQWQESGSNKLVSKTPELQLTDLHIKEVKSNDSNPSPQLVNLLSPDRNLSPFFHYKISSNYAHFRKTTFKIRIKSDYVSPWDKICK